MRENGRLGYLPRMAEIDHNVSPVLDALEDFQARNYATFSPPGHKQGKGADGPVRRVLGAEVFRADILATGGLDDRKSSGKVRCAGTDLTEADSGPVRCA